VKTTVKFKFSTIKYLLPLPDAKSKFSSISFVFGLKNDASKFLNKKAFLKLKILLL